MQFITTDQRIAVENFEIGLIYTVTFTGGRYFSGACIGKGADFVMFQRTAPELVYCLNMAAAAEVESIEQTDSGSGTLNYNELYNKLQINGVELSGNKSLDNLGIQAKITYDDMPTIDSNNPVKSSGIYTALGEKQDALSSEQLNAVNSGITTADVTQIGTNKNNILFNTNMGVKNLLNISDNTYTVTGLTVVAASGELTFTSTNATTHAIVVGTFNLKAGTYVLSDRAGGGKGFDIRLFVDGENVTPTVETATFTLSADKTVEIRFYSYATISNQTIKPMLCLKSLYDADTSYQPYAMSNAEITAWILAHS